MKKNDELIVVAYSRSQDSFHYDSIKKTLEHGILNVHNSVVASDFVPFAIVDSAKQAWEQIEAARKIIDNEEEE